MKTPPILRILLSEHFVRETHTDGDSRLFIPQPGRPGEFCDPSEHEECQDPYEHLLLLQEPSHSLSRNARPESFPHIRDLLILCRAPFGLTSFVESHLSVLLQDRGNRV